MEIADKKPRDLAGMVMFCKINIPKGHLSHIMPLCSYPELYEILQLGESAFYYGSVRKFITHAQAVEAIKLKVSLRRLYLAHSTYSGDIMHTDSARQRKMETESGHQHHAAIMRSAASGFDIYDYAILAKAASEDEIKELLFASDDIKWYAQLRLIGLPHSAVMSYISNELPLEAVWEEYREVSSNAAAEEEVVRRLRGHGLNQLPDDANPFGYSDPSDIEWARTCKKGKSGLPYGESPSRKQMWADAQAKRDREALPSLSTVIGVLVFVLTSLFVLSLVNK